MDATKAWTKNCETDEILLGLPESALQGAKETAKQKGVGGYVLTLEIPCYQAVMTYAHKRSLRKEIYEAYVTRASDKGPFAKKWDNTPIMNEILSLRSEIAQLLGFQNYAELSLDTKMADSPEQVLGFLDELVKHSRKKGFDDLSELEKYLETGNFYTRKKENSKNYFMKFDNFNKRDQLLNDILTKIHQ